MLYLLLLSVIAFAYQFRSVNAARSLLKSACSDLAASPDPKLLLLAARIPAKFWPRGHTQKQETIASILANTTAKSELGFLPDERRALLSCLDTLTSSARSSDAVEAARIIIEALVKQCSEAELTHLQDISSSKSGNRYQAEIRQILLDVIRNRVPQR